MLYFPGLPEGDLGHFHPVVSDLMPDRPDSRAKETRRLLLERRTVVRFPSQLEALVRTGGGKTGVEWPGRVRDISLKGISLILSRNYPAGTVLNLKLLRDKDTPTHSMQATVMHVLSESCGYLHGCQLVQELTPDELSLLLQ